MKAALTFLRLVSLTMAVLSSLPLASGILYLVGLEPFSPLLSGDESNLYIYFAALANWHHHLYWDAATALGIIGRHVPIPNALPVYFAIHGTNVLLGLLSIRSFLRAPSDPGTVAIGPTVSYLLPYVQQAALWALNAITAGVLGNYVWEVAFKRMLLPN